MKVLAVADLHGYLPDIEPCDLLLIAGDVCPVHNHSLSFQASWLDHEFRRWLERVPATEVVGIAGNHDFIFQQEPHGVPTGLRWRYLECAETVLGNGLTIWGCPWQLWFFDWAFNAPQRDGEAFLEKIYAGIPEGTQVVVSHGPPLGYGDLTVRNKRAGSRALWERLQAIRPRLTVFGHIHEGRGRWDLGWGTLANASIVDVHYGRAHPPMAFEL